MKSFEGGVIIERNEDGSYTCPCGEELPNAVALYHHRQAEHPRPMTPGQDQP